MTQITPNAYFAKALEKGLVRNPTARLTTCLLGASQQCVQAQILLDYEVATIPPGTRMQAYGATVLFSHLSIADYDRMANTAIAKHGRTPQAEAMVARELLGRDDAIAVYQDAAVLNHPALAAVVAGLPERFADYEGGDVQQRPAERIAMIVDERNLKCAFDGLDQEVLPAWRDIDATAQARTADTALSR